MRDWWQRGSRSGGATACSIQVSDWQRLQLLLMLCCCDDGGHRDKPTCATSTTRCCSLSFPQPPCCRADNLSIIGVTLDYGPYGWMEK